MHSVAMTDALDIRASSEAWSVSSKMVSVATALFLPLLLPLLLFLLYTSFSIAFAALAAAVAVAASVVAASVVAASVVAAVAASAPAERVAVVASLLWFLLLPVAVAVVSLAVFHFCWHVIAA